MARHVLPRRSASAAAESDSGHSDSEESIYTTDTDDGNDSSMDELMETLKDGNLDFPDNIDITPTYTDTEFYKYPRDAEKPKLICKASETVCSHSVVLMGKVVVGQRPECEDAMPTKAQDWTQVRIVPNPRNAKGKAGLTEVVKGMACVDSAESKVLKVYVLQNMQQYKKAEAALKNPNRTIKYPKIRPLAAALSLRLADPAGEHAPDADPSLSESLELLNYRISNSPEDPACTEFTVPYIFDTPLARSIIKNVDAKSAKKKRKNDADTASASAAPAAAPAAGVPEPEEAPKKIKRALTLKPPTVSVNDGETPADTSPSKEEVGTTPDKPPPRKKAKTTQSTLSPGKAKVSRKDREKSPKRSPKKAKRTAADATLNTEKVAGSPLARSESAADLATAAASGAVSDGLKAAARTLFPPTEDDLVVSLDAAIAQLTCVRNMIKGGQ